MNLPVAVAGCNPVPLVLPRGGASSIVVVVAGIGVARPIVVAGRRERWESDFRA